MSTHHLSLYDVLGVEPDASPAEIKAAWREATDRFEPGSSPAQFRMFNEAADVLLDPRKREEYDAELAGDRVPQPAGAPHHEDDASPAETAAPLAAPRPARPWTRRGGAAAAAASSSSTRPDRPRAERSPRSTASESSPPRLGSALVATLASANAVVVVLLAVLAVAAVTGAAFAAVSAHRQAEVASARIEAPPAAERAVRAMFSYDYRDLSADKARAIPYMTSGFAKKYVPNFDALEKQKDGSPGLAVQTKAVVSASVQGSGVVDAEADVVRVLVFVNLNSRKGTSDPQIFQNRVAMTMVKQGDRWLVDNVASY